MHISDILLFSYTIDYLRCLTLGTPHTYAQSHYQIGYDDGCAGRVVEGHHTSDYRRGYADGQAACSKSSGSSQTELYDIISNKGRDRNW